jgi:hypothetical protein
MFVSSDLRGHINHVLVRMVQILVAFHVRSRIRIYGIKKVLDLPISRSKAHLEPGCYFLGGG